MPKKKDKDEPAAEEGSGNERAREFHPKNAPDDDAGEEGKSVGIGLPVSAEEYARLKKQAEGEQQAEPDDEGQQDDAD